MKKILTLFKVGSYSSLGKSAQPGMWVTNLILFFCISAGISLSIAFYSESKIEAINNNIVEINNTKINLHSWLTWTNLQNFKSLKHEIELVNHIIDEGEEYADFGFFTTLLDASYTNLHYSLLNSHKFLADHYPTVLENFHINHTDFSDHEKQFEEIRYTDTYDALAFEKFVAENKKSLKLRYRILQSAIIEQIQLLDQMSLTAEAEIQTMMAFTTKLLLTSFFIQILIYILWQYVEFSIFRDHE